jgi:apolipoprotein N-acyltransferase
MRPTTFPARMLMGIALSALGAVLLTLSMAPYGIWSLAVIGAVAIPARKSAP